MRQASWDLVPKVTSIEALINRNNFCKTVAWSLPSPDALAKIAEFVGTDTLHDIGAGHGFWSALLAQMGLSVKAYDLFFSGGYTSEDDPFFDVQLVSTPQILRLPDVKAIMLNWPPYNEPMAFRYVSQLEPKKLVYVGEDYGGCTADDNFFDYVRANYAVKDYVKIPNWYSIHDGVELLVRN
jgi:hypothetical protein